MQNSFIEAIKVNFIIIAFRRIKQLIQPCGLTPSRTRRDGSEHVAVCETEVCAKVRTYSHCVDKSCTESTVDQLVAASTNTSTNTSDEKVNILKLCMICNEEDVL